MYKGLLWVRQIYVWAIQGKTLHNYYNDRVKEANNIVEQAVLPDTTYDEFLYVSDMQIVSDIKQSLDQVQDLKSIVTLQDKTYNKDGTVDVTLSVTYVSMVDSDWRETFTYHKHFTITDSSELKWSIYHLDVKLKPQYQTDQVKYSEFIHIDASNLENYIDYYKNPDYTYEFEGSNISYNPANPIVDKATDSLSFYVTVNDGAEKATSNLNVLTMNVAKPLVLTSKIVDENFSSGGIWNAKTSLTMDDYHEYDYIANDAFIHQHLESLQIPSTSEIFENAFKSIQFDTIKKFDVVGQIMHW